MVRDDAGRDAINTRVTCQHSNVSSFNISASAAPGTDSPATKCEQVMDEITKKGLNLDELMSKPGINQEKTPNSKTLLKHK